MADNTGGPAFPVELSFDEHGQHEKQTGNHSFLHSGMALRDYFAAKAMATLLQDAVLPTKEDRDEWLPKLAEVAYESADAMLAAREKETL